ncbi:zinc finger protein 236 [Elysia marginata]|uniref:Zinc finger protein 236 n=1 Tax=Elysia marginata TaxID=1093978 RepID=A0AAV4H7R0_9GAST|nr:zinc finger protein 236 [Elysia marginata]
MVVHSDGVTSGGERVTVVLDEVSDANPLDSQQISGDINSIENTDKSLEEPIEGVTEQTPNVVVVTSEADFGVTTSAHVGDITVNTGKSSKETPPEQQMSSQQTSETEVITDLEPLGEIWNTQDDDNEPEQIAAEVDISSHSLHLAQDRQEAALGLAELSLFGAGAAGVTSNSADPPPGSATATQQQPNQKTKTFFKEEEEDENDPNVTKIILSKEGGVMNSQDPHQCPVCHRIFGRKSIMVEHLRIHTDEKPYVCDFCGAGFRQNAQLRSHIRNRHTKVERYQCSFCHNRFLSRSITIRHIKFHHKLKMKFCQEANPEWTVDSAVWCDDKFEFNIEDPQYLKVSKKSKANGKKIKKGVTYAENREGTLSQTLADLMPSGQTFVVKVSDQEQMASSEVTIETSEIESQGIALDGEEEKTDQGLAKASARTVGTLTYATPGSNQGEEEEAHTNPLVTDSEYMSSHLLCGTCKMQFSSVSSLREHLRNIHDTTLAESDVSYVFEDNMNAEGNQVTSGPEANSEEKKEQAQQVVSDIQTEMTLQELKPVVLNVEELPQRTGKVELTNHVDVKECYNICRMCSQAFYYRDDLDQHMKSHSEEEVESAGMHRCDTCSLVMKNTQEVAKHIQRCHGVSKIFSCSICDKEFFQESSVYRHMKFFHKWEIKIRGENNIPVIVKPAPKVLHNPATSSSGYTMPKTRTDRRKVGRYGKFPTQGTTIGAEVDKIIQDVVESKVPIEASQPDTSRLKIELASHSADILEKSIGDSLTASSTSEESQAPSFIIVRDGAVAGDRDTEKIVEKLMALFRSKADSADGDLTNLPKTVKVTTVGFSQDEIKTITETDLTKAFNQLDENNETCSSQNQIIAPASIEIASQIVGSSGDNLSGKGYISTLQGKKRVVGQEVTANNTKSAVASTETKLEDSYSETSGTVQAATKSSLAQMLKKNKESQLAKNRTSTSADSQEGLDQPSVKSSNSRRVSQLVKHMQTSCGSQSGIIESPQIISEEKVALEEQEKLNDGIESEVGKKAVLKNDQETITEVITLGAVPKKSTISTLVAPAQNQQSFAKSEKILTNVTITDSSSSRPKASDDIPSVTSENISGGQGTEVVSERTNPVAEESKVSEERNPTSKAKKAAKVKATKQKLGEPQPERRSSSGRLIKRKKFGDEIEDMSPLRKRHK